VTSRSVVTTTIESSVDDAQIIESSSRYSSLSNGSFESLADTASTVTRSGVEPRGSLRR